MSEKLFGEKRVKCSCCISGCLSHLHRYEETWFYRGFDFLVCGLINFIGAILSHDLFNCGDSTAFKLCLFVPPVKPTKQSTIIECSWSARLKNLLLGECIFHDHSWTVMEFWFVGGEYKNLAEERTVTFPTLDAGSLLCSSLKRSKPISFHEATATEC